MDSYDLFGDDGSGMLEGLTDLGGTHSFSNTSATTVTGDNKDPTESSYRQSYSQPSVPPEGSLQKLASFGSGGSGGIPSNTQTGQPGGGGAPSDYHDYGSYPPRPRMPQPPHGPMHSSHHVHPSHAYPGYHPGPDPMYSMPDHPGMGEMGVWSAPPSSGRYPSIGPAYRHPYEHQQKIHQYAPQQGLQGVPQNGSYIPRQPHFAQPPSQPIYAQQQNYPGYPQVHPPPSSRLGPHPGYHQQIDINPHQYGLAHNQQPLGNVAPQHQPHQNMTSHQGSMGPGIQGPPVHLHHASMHHSNRQPTAASNATASSHSIPPPYANPHHTVPINYQGHQLQPPLDVNMGVSNQYGPPKPHDSGSPQYRPPFQQLSPQISPRAQMSPRPQAPPQLSPRPSMSPVKGSNVSPHTARPLNQSPVTVGPPANAYSSQNTLQALEQMVLPGNSEYSYQRNPASPAVSHMVSSPTHWNQNKIPVPTSNVMPIETMDRTGVGNNSLPPTAYHQKNLLHIENKHIELPHHHDQKEKPDIHVSSILTDPKPNENSSKCPLNIIEAKPEQEQPLVMKENEITDEIKTSNEASGASNNDKRLTKHDSTDIQARPPNAEIPHLQPVNQVVQGIPTCPIINASSQIHVSQLTPEENTTTNTYSMPDEHPNPPLLGNIEQGVTVTTGVSENSATNAITNVQSSFANQKKLPPMTSDTIVTNVPSSVPSGNSTSIPINSSNITNIESANINMLSKTMPPVSNQSSLINNTIQGTHSSNIPAPAGNTNIQPQLTSNIPNVPLNLPINAPNVHTNLNPNVLNNQGTVVANLQQPMVPQQHNMAMLMSPGSLPHPNIQGMYQNPINHHQERMFIQQQIQEIFCLPPTPENQEKLRCLQERLSILQQHESAEKCNGGPNCLLQNPMYGSKMIESPQVSSTTGRGRSKGPSRPRKPRTKKDKLAAQSNIQSLEQLPVSEDCVTAGTGLLNIGSEMDGENNEELTNLDSSAILYEGKDGKMKKPRAPRKQKERKPRVPKEQKTKIDGDEKPKERKKREPRDPNAPKRKRVLKKDDHEMLADTTTYQDISDKMLDTSEDSIFKIQAPEPIIKCDPSLGDVVTDFDDIPVSKIAIKDLLEEAEAKRELEDKEEDFDALNASPSKKKFTKRRSVGNSNTKKGAVKKGISAKKKKRGGIVPESDGEPDDLMATPPPSPPTEGDCDSLKRRSARHTQRKKYTDDVMLRLSDDEYSMMNTVKLDKDIKLDDVKNETTEGIKPEVIPKPNYMYVNTTDEDTMIVQHVLASRMGKREIKPTVSIEKTEIEKPNEKNENELTLNILGDNIIDESNGEKLSESEKHLTLLPDEREIVKDEKDIFNPENEKEKPISVEKVESKQLESTPVSNEQPIIIDIEEYYVKYRNFSYLHCEWKTEEELYKGDKRIFSKIKRFKQKQAQQLNIFELFDEEPFNPDYVEVERILDVSDTVDPGNEKSNIKHYLVKWKSLQYEDSTWELEEDVDVDKIKQFELFNSLPSKDKWKFKRRPVADQWIQLKESPLYKGGNTLRLYQLEGLNWLLFSWYNNRNCILADEMGLGKTIQSLTFVNSVWEFGIRGPFLIIAPLSTIPNWQREFEAWTDMNVVVYHGSQQSKSMIQEYEFYFKNDKGVQIKDINKFNVLITTFEVIVTDFQDLKTINWRVCVIDEAHRLKNRNCKLLEGLRQLHLEHRVLLSGTPLQNNVNELFSLLNFLEPSQFSSSEAFLTEFGQLKSESEVMKLQALLKPMMLRRLKEDVEKTLAPKEETIIEVELTNIQKKYYRAILERNFSFLQKGTASAANIPNLMNTMMELRKCCIHPYLLNGAEDQIQFDYKQANGEDKQAYYKALIQSSGKMVLVDKLLPKLKAGGHRVLIFSQMVRCLDILEDYMVYKKYPFERIDGRIRGNLRQEAIDRFSKPDSDRFVFLLCTKAGGLGINLTAADTVIIYDSDWNPQNDLQAQARCHRIGQQKMVKIYRVICRNTYEREMFDKASLKLGLDKAILQSMNTGQSKEAGIRQLSKKEIEDLLKKGAYGAVMDEDNAGDKFCEEDIEMILARRTQVIQMESEKGSTFSKASFSSNDQRSDIDIRDPDFWNKWAKKADIDTTEKKDDDDLIVTEPRRRTIIKRYGHDDSTMEMSDMDVTPDSDDDEEGISLRSKRKKDKFGRKGRKYTSDEYVPRHDNFPMDEEVVYGAWSRSDCFKIERGLLTFGWSRWDEILDKNQLRKGWTIPAIEECARIIALYCLRHYKGDEKIRNFIWDLIEPCENGEVTISRNHSGLHNPVPRGRNAKKKNKPKDIPKSNAPQKWEDPNHWSSGDKYDCDVYLESSYKKHLFRHANKVLLRIRMMYYIKHEVIGDYVTQIDAGLHASALGMRVPRGVDNAPPRLWWDTDCDVSLLVGTYVHGYENYLAMRRDPQLCFVDKLGPPDDAECTDINEERKVRGGVGDEDCTDEVSSAGATSPGLSPRHDDDSLHGGSSHHPWPSMQDLNTRLRRLITAYQRNYKREELKLQQRAKIERRERMEQLSRDDSSQWRWTKADEEAFRRTVASYGVEFDPATKSLRWGRFRILAHLDSKSDDALTDYLKAFMAMCKRQCGLSVGEAELPTRPDLKAEPIGEERAIATLERIDLLRVLREEVAPHPALDTRLALCERSADTPSWWQPAKHDKLLVLGVCKHGLGDTYHKLFCDPKLPFADCANVRSSNLKTQPTAEIQRMSSDDDDDDVSRDKPSLRRSKRNTVSNDQDLDEDTDALSELETLAKLGRAEESPSPNHWFTERALETRLHHIAHTIQNCEWPISVNQPKNIDTMKKVQSKIQDERSNKKQHIAIDVETERAKLHALLSSPHPAHSNARERRPQFDLNEGSAKIGWERDEASSDSGSLRSTPAPPPAHQRPAPSPAPPSMSGMSAPVDLSAPLDLSEVQDFSIGRRTPAHDSSSLSSSSAIASNANKRKLDDTLSKLMKRKNVPEPEHIVGKEKKRKKLDEIVLGLSAAKGHSVTTSFVSPEPAKNKSPIVPNVTVTPAIPSSSNSPKSLQKPFSVTVTNVPSPQSTPKELSSFLQQSLEQSNQSKVQKMTTHLNKPYSHEAKVNKWLAEQASVENRRRGQQPPRLAPDEHVPVVHRVTGKRLVGHKAPQLKHLAQWIAENPMYDIDSKWTDGIKEHVKLPQDVRAQRHSQLPSPSSMGERKKGRPSALDSAAAAAAALSSNAHLNQNLAGLNPALLASLSGLSSFDPKTLAATLSNLTGFDAKTMSAFDPKLLSSLNSFDPKTNPLLSSFGNVPNLMGNLSGSNLFSNLASLGLSGFSGMDLGNLNVNNPTADNKSSKSRKHSDSSASNKSNTSSQFPFVFPNPNMLYPQLGLSSLNPFGMSTGMSSAYDALGLLSNGLVTSASTAHSSAQSSSRNTSKNSSSRSATITTNSSHSRQHKGTSDRQQSSQLSQLLLPPDTYLLDSLSKQCMSFDSSSKTEKRSRDVEMMDPAASDLTKAERKCSTTYDSARTQLPPEFAAVQERLLRGDKRDIDISKMLLEQMASGALSASLVSSVEAKKITDINSKESYERLAKNHADYMGRNSGQESNSSNAGISHKRQHDELINEPENLIKNPAEAQISKKIKEIDDKGGQNTPNVERKPEQSQNTVEMDLEDLIAPSTVIKTGAKSSDIETTNQKQRLPEQQPLLSAVEFDDKAHHSRLSAETHSDEGKLESVESESRTNKDLIGEFNEDTNVSSEENVENDSSRRNSKKKPRKSTEDVGWGGVRRELRSSGRQSSR